MTITFNELLAIVLVFIGLGCLFLLFWRRPPLVDTKEQAKEEQIHVTFEAQRKTEAERIQGLDKAGLQDEGNHPRR